MGGQETKSIYKLLIADDEYWIREELRNMLDWSRYDIDVLDSASDGEEAWKKVQEWEPDILISDVNMPFMDGVELVKRTKTSYPNTQVIMLSGYNDFNYVKESLLAGAMDYILKPISKMELIKVMKKAMDQINTEMMLHKEKEIERSRLLKASSSLNDREYSALITNEKTHDSKDVFHFTQTGGMTIPEGGFSAIVIKIHGLNTLADLFGYDMNLLSYSIKKRIEENCHIQTMIIFNNIYATSEFVLIVNEKKDVLKEASYYLLIALKEFTKHTISIGISNVFFSELDFYEAYQQAKMALMMREFSDGSVVNFYKEVKENAKQEEQLTQEMEKQIASYMQNNPGKLKDFVFHKMGLARIQEEGWSLLRVQRAMRVVMYSILLTKVKDSNMQIDLEVDNWNASMKHAIENMEYEELMSQLAIVCDMAIDTDNVVSANVGGKHFVGEIVTYIDEHYFEDISLSMLADKFHIESTYLSKLFKKETSENLMNYIARRRIDRACELIQEDGTSLTEIAFRVGYDDYNYFNKVFKKMMNCSPREYKANLKVS